MVTRDSKVKRFQYLRTQEGGIHVKSNIPGYELSDDDFDMLCKAIDGALKMKNLKDRTVWKDHEGLTAGEILVQKGGTEVEVDEIVVQLERHRKALGFTRRRIAETMFMGVGEFSGVFQGKHRARLDIVRPFALLLGMRIMLVPNSLYEIVKTLVDKWEEARFEGYAEPFGEKGEYEDLIGTQ